MRALLALALLAVGLAGCTSAPGPGSSPPPPPAPTKLVSQAPWWDVGDVYGVVFQRGTAAATTWRMVNFWNDTETDHFWLGVSDRQLAMDMALFDTNPFMGRIHHHILTPHERGMHAAMYNFPLEDGKTWGGFFLDRNWTFTSTEATITGPSGPHKGFRVEGVPRDGAGGSIRFTYSPQVRWFTELEQVDRSGARVLSATLSEYTQGATGTYLFLRGRDFYEGPRLPGTHEESFTVGEQVDALAFYVKARASGPLEVQLLDPQGQVRQRATAATGGEANLFREVRPAPMGEWKVRYVATGAIEGTVLGTGLLETSRSI